MGERVFSVVCPGVDSFSFVLYCFVPILLIASEMILYFSTEWYHTFPSFKQEQTELKQLGEKRAARGLAQLLIGIYHLILKLIFSHQWKVLKLNTWSFQTYYVLNVLYYNYNY